MSDPTRAAEALPHIHRLVTPQSRRPAERSWSCSRCEGRGYVYETVAMHLGGKARTYQSAARCRCKAGDRMSPSMAPCSDAFWYGIGAEPEYEPPAESEDWSSPSPPEPIVPEPTPWAGTVVEELDP